jgi:hypothetical protein
MQNIQFVRQMRPNGFVWQFSLLAGPMPDSNLMQAHTGSPLWENGPPLIHMDISSGVLRNKNPISANFCQFLPIPANSSNA